MTKMTTRAWLEAAKADRRLTAASRETITALVPYVDSDGRAEPDTQKIARDLNIGVSTVYLRYKRLTETGYLLHVGTAPSDNRAHLFEITTPGATAALEERVSTLERENSELREALDAVIDRLDELERANRPV